MSKVSTVKTFTETAATLISLIQSIPTLLSLNPHIDEVTPDPADTNAYDITATFPSPVGLGTMVSKYRSVFTITQDGIEFLSIGSDTGIKTATKWSVKDVPGSGSEVTKVDQVDGPWILRQFVVGKLKKTSEVMMENLKNEAAKKGSAQ
ncbi:hypothetical protein [Phaffia rhodozyma]|uniref:Polyketide cyclase/dehydrase n=1 Tax=Phaffia rhodozyma TaxID=264483 RepID=A0A0F7SIE2_PHARH|nr:hypothetical protein [Phaffia rhodozyma]